MTRYLKFAAVAFVLALTAPVFAFQDDAEPTLDVGSPAPELDVEYWLSRGVDDKFPKVTKFEPGKVYVVEFWATWCPPCVASMPHLSKLQDKYADSVQIVSISDESLETVEGFLLKKLRDDPSKTYAQLTKNYCLAADPDESSHVDYTQAAGVPGIPAAFLIGKTGKIEWIGHPMGIDEPLELVVTDKFDPEAYKKLEAERKQRREKLQQSVGEAMQLAQGGKTDEAIAKLDATIAEADEDTRLSLEFLKVQMLGSVGKPDLAIKQLDQMLSKASDDEVKIELKMMKFEILVSEEMPGIEKMFFEVADLDKDAAFQNSVAWSVVQMNLEGVIVSPKMLAKARALADAAVAAEPVPDVLETQAHLVFMQGDVDKAIAIQKRAIADARDEELMGRLKHFLEEWEAEKKPQELETESGEQVPEPRRE